jgi:hypothetical protein
LKPRHAAALALVGWYLITPPVTGNSDADMGVKIGAPFSEWDIVDSYDTAAQSRDGLSGNVKSFEHEQWSATVAERDRKAIITAAQSARCIATDDPRLK